MRYRVLAGLDYKGRDGTPRRAEPGEVVDDLPATSTGWLLARGAIEDAPPEFDQGGVLQPGGTARNTTGRPEPVRRKRTSKGGES
jgi:hypothetical protein